MTVHTIEIGGRTYHLRATMRALRDASREHGVQLNDIESDPLNLVVLAYHFAKAGARSQGTELTMSLEEFEETIEAGDLPGIVQAFESVMNVDGKKKV